jgi:hypothetical protein
MGFLTKNTEETQVGSPVAQRYGTFRTITASGQKINVTDKKDIAKVVDRKVNNKWQEEAWDYFDAIGEIKYAYTVFSNVLSRIRIYGAYVDDDRDSPTPLKESPISDEARIATEKAMRRVFGNGNQSQLLRKAGLNILVVGECFLINEMVYESGRRKEVWRIVSTDELVTDTKGYLALRKSKDVKPSDYVRLAENAFVGRIWREHPRYTDEADSALKSLCDTCNELLLLSRTVRSTARSRLNAGVFFVPDELSVSYDTPTDSPSADSDIEDYTEEEDQELEDALIDLFSTPVSDETSIYSLIPVILRGPSDLGEKLKHITFERAFDTEMSDRADRALERILQGLDMPKEMITGLANIKYSNAVQINESFYTGHIEPLVLMLCDVFKTVYLEPALLAAGVDPEEIDKIVIWYDPSGIVTAPDKSSAANVGFDKYALSLDAWRRANGFTEDDKPSREEIIERIAITRGSLSPELTDTIFREMFPDMMNKVRENTIANQEAPIPDSVERLLNPDVDQAPPNNPTEVADTTSSTTDTTTEDVSNPDTLPTPEELIGE